MAVDPASSSHSTSVPPEGSSPVSSGGGTAPATLPPSTQPGGRFPPPDDGRNDRLPVWGFTGSDRWLLTISLVVMAGLLSAHVWRDLHRRSQPVEILHPHGVYPYRVPLNSANWVEWAQLDGIGEKLARRIVADREQHGPFTSVDDLRRVKGIGPKTLEKIRPFVQDEPTAEP
jgi:competence protein ComEA